MLSGKLDGREMMAMDVVPVLLREEYVETMASLLVLVSYSIVLMGVFSNFVAEWKDQLVVPLPVSRVARWLRWKTCRCYSSL